MITITNGRKQIRVTAGAYQNYFRHLGYQPVEETEAHENPECGYTHPPEEAHVSGSSAASSEDFSDESGEAPEEDDVALAEIPLSEMSLSQLYAYAEELGLDYEGITSKKGMRALIREHLE